MNPVCFMPAVHDDVSPTSQWNQRGAVDRSAGDMGSVALPVATPVPSQPVSLSMSMQAMHVPDLVKRVGCL